MNNTLKKLMATRDWIAHIDDERDIGNSIIVTLKDGYSFCDGDKEGVRGYDTIAEVKEGTKRLYISFGTIHIYN